MCKLITVAAANRLDYKYIKNTLKVSSAKWIIVRPDIKADAEVRAASLGLSVWSDFWLIRAEKLASLQVCFCLPALRS